MKDNLVSDLRETIAHLTKLATRIEDAPPARLDQVGVYMSDARKPIVIDDTIFLSVFQARKAVALLMWAIYESTRDPSDPYDPAAHKREAAFLDALKGGLVHSLKDEQIARVMRDVAPPADGEGGEGDG